MSSYLPSLLSLINGIVLIALGVGVTWYWKTYDARATAAKEAAADKARWRQGRIDAEKRLEDAIAAERSERTQWQLKREAELASIAGILEESTEAHKLLAGIASTTRHLEGNQSRTDHDVRELRTRIDTMQNHIHDLLSHAKP